MRNQPLFDLMSREHGLTLLESEMHEIELTVARILATDRVPESARPSAESVGCSDWVEELEAALRHLKNSNEMPRSKGGDTYDRQEVCGTICVIQDIVDAERSRSSTDRLQ